MNCVIGAQIILTYSGNFWWQFYKEWKISYWPPIYDEVIFLGTWGNFISVNVLKLYNSNDLFVLGPDPSILVSQDNTEHIIHFIVFFTKKVTNLLIYSIHFWTERIAQKLLSQMAWGSGAKKKLIFLPSSK